MNERMPDARLWNSSGGKAEWLRLIDFINPGSKAVQGVIAQAKLKVPNGEFPAYVCESGNPDEVRKLVNAQVRAIYETLRERGVGYAVERWDSCPTAQVIRTHQEVLNTNMIGGPCLDLVLLMAACLEAVGIQPLVIVLEGGKRQELLHHAILGYRLAELRYGPEIPVDQIPPLLSESALRRLKMGNNIAFLNCTGITRGENAPFAEARSQGDDYADYWNSIFALDVKAARHTALTREMLAYLEEIKDYALALPPTFGFPADVSFDDIRIPIKVRRGERHYNEAEARAREIARREGWEEEERAKAYRYPWPSLEEAERAEERPLDWDREVRRRVRQAAVLGDPGFGKTWLLRHEALRLAEDALAAFREKFLFEIDDPEKPELIKQPLEQEEIPPQLKVAFAENGFVLSDYAYAVKKEPGEWTIVERAWVFSVKAEGRGLRIYRAGLGKYPLSEPDVLLPVFLPLASVAAQLDEGGTSSFEDAVLAALAQGYDLGSELRRWMVGALEKGKLVLLLDALDEVPHERKEALVRELGKFVGKYPDTNIILTSRIVGFPPRPTWLHEDEVFELLPFNGRQQRKFVRAWFIGQPERGDEFLRKLRGAPQLQALARVPLLLAMMCSLFDEKGELPQTRAELYEACLYSLLLRTWHTDQEGKPPREEDARLDAKLELAEELAFRLFLQGKELFWHRELRETIRDILEELPYLKEELVGNARELIEELEGGGLLIKAGEGLNPPYLFLHLTFQEYLAARALARSTELVRFEGKRVPEWLALVKPHFFDPRWEEVIRLLAALFPDATPLVQAIWQEPEDIFLGRLLLVGKCLSNAQHVQKELRDEIVGDIFALLEGGKTLDRYLPETKVALQRVLVMLAATDGSVFLRLVSLVERTKDPELVRSLAVNPTEKLIPHLIPLLRYSPTADMESAREWVRKNRNRDVQQIFALFLWDLQTSVRMAAAEVLGEIGSETLIPYLVTLLRDSDATIRVTAADLLGKTRNKAVVHHLVPLLRAPDSAVRATAAEALGEIGDGEVTSHLMGLLKDRSPDVRLAAAVALGNIGSESAVAHLVPLLGDPDPTVRVVVIDVLASFRSIAIPCVLPLLLDSRSYVRRAVVRTLGESMSEAVIPYLIALLEDRDPDVKISAIEELGSTRAKSTISDILPLTRDPTSGVRAAAAEALGKIGGEAAIPYLLPLLGDSTVRMMVVRIIGRIGNKSAIPHIVPLLQAPDSAVRAAAAEALGKIGGEVAIPYLLPILEDPDPGVKIVAVKEVGRIGGVPAIPLLLPLLDDTDVDIKRTVVEELGRIGGKSVISCLRSLCGDTETPIKEAAVDALVKVGDEALVSHFMKFIRQSSYECYTQSRLHQFLMRFLKGGKTARVFNQRRLSRTRALLVLRDISRKQGIRIFPDGTWIRISKENRSE